MTQTSTAPAPASSSPQGTGRAIDRLTIRLAAGIAAIVLMPLGIGLYALSRNHERQSIEVRRRAAELQNRVIEATLRHQMLRKDRTLLTSILDEMGAAPEVHAAMILDHEGVVRISTRPATVGDRMERDSAACMVCHAVEPSDRDGSVLLHGEDGQLLRSVLPIANELECQECHDPGERLNGILILDIDLRELHADLSRDVRWMVGGTACLGIAVLLGVGFLVRSLVLHRLGRLSRTARVIAAGDLEARAQVDGGDVIGSLAGEFNHMADSVVRLVAEVREREGELAAVLNNIDDGLVVLDRESRVVASNRAFCRRLGTHPETLRGHSCREESNAGLPCCASEVDCPALRCLETGLPQREIYRTSAPGECGSVVEEVHASPVFDDSGEVIQVVELWREITERVQEQERLAEIERLASLGVLASGFSHEVNTPLASILTCAEATLGILETPIPAASQELAETLSDHAETIRSQVLRCRKITDQFLRFSRGVPPATEPMDVRQVVESVIDLARPTAREAGVELRYEPGPSLPPVAANAELVQHVALNLLVNAIQSCQDGGGLVQVSFQVSREIRVQIDDTGCGIRSEERAHLFEPFRSSKPLGTGLGLFLSRSFMRRFGGDVVLVSSAKGQGSRFQIVFARADEVGG